MCEFEENSAEKYDKKKRQMDENRRHLESHLMALQDKYNNYEKQVENHIELIAETNNFTK